MSHDQIREQLKAYLDGELDFFARRRVESHLDSCDECRTEVAVMREIGSKLQQSATPDASPLLRSRILDRVRRERLQEDIERAERRVERRWFQRRPAGTVVYSAMRGAPSSGRSASGFSFRQWAIALGAVALVAVVTFPVFRSMSDRREPAEHGPRSLNASPAPATSPAPSLGKSGQVADARIRRGGVGYKGSRSPGAVGASTSVDAPDFADATSSAKIHEKNSSISSFAERREPMASTGLAKGAAAASSDKSAKKVDMAGLDHLGAPAVGRPSPSAVQKVASPDGVPPDDAAAKYQPSPGRGSADFGGGVSADQSRQAGVPTSEQLVGKMGSPKDETQLFLMAAEVKLAVEDVSTAVTTLKNQVLSINAANSGDATNSLYFSNSKAKPDEVLLRVPISQFEGQLQRTLSVGKLVDQNIVRQDAVWANRVRAQSNMDDRKSKKLGRGADSVGTNAIQQAPTKRELDAARAQSHWATIRVIFEQLQKPSGGKKK